MGFFSPHYREPSRHRLNYKIVCQFETNDRLGRNLNVPVPSQTAQRRTSTCANKTANQQPNAAGSNTAYEHPESGTSADKRSRPFALAFFGLRQITRIQPILACRSTSDKSVASRRSSCP